MRSISTNFTQFVLSAALVGAGVFCAAVCHQASTPDVALAATSAAQTTKGYSTLSVPGVSRDAATVSKSRAKQIALDHAGYSKKKVKNLTAKVGHRGHAKAVIVKFRYRKIRYNYAINRKTGQVISYVARLSA